MLSRLGLVVFVALFGLSLAAAVPAASSREDLSTPAIVLAAFGTSENSALPAILAVRDRVAAAFPRHPLRLAFTSGQIRGIWRQRAADPAYRAENPDVPADIYQIEGVFATLARLQDEGMGDIVLQSLHITSGEEVANLSRLVSSLADLKTERGKAYFTSLRLGDPALGPGEGEPADITRAVAALQPVASRSRDAGQILVLMAHGNQHLRQAVYQRLEDALRREYGADIYLGTVEAGPTPQEIAETIGQSQGAGKGILLAPLMLVAGDHALNDMASDDPESWASIFQAAGFPVECLVSGLGSNPLWADIYVESLRRQLADGSGR
ncbi:MAG: sirohydrochlorin cobaltochelatase [Planctomycetota bacterium]|jgi:sirohydrochlorin cobaltochelatase|nr:sirohydrochlorin cobaltochelatase [Planctomycetota bacterium]